MSARETSIAVYLQIEAEGLLSRKRWDVYRVLYAGGPMTAAEVACALPEGTERVGISPRFAELKRCGVITEVGTRVCGVTGRSVIAWDVTAGLPVEPVKSVPLSKQVKLLRAALLAFGRHRSECTIYDVGSSVCCCGYQDALRLCAP